MKFTPPIRRVDTAKGHYYRDADGNRVPGVTTIISKGVPKDALINWAGNATADYAVNNWDELAKLPPAARLTKLRKARYEDRDTAGARGTEVHHYAEQLVQGKSVDVPVELAGHAEAYAKFLLDFDVEPVHVEFSVASYAYGYAGTGDLIAYLTIPGIGRVLGLCDVKTNRSGIFGEVGLQLAGYRYADVLIDDDGEHPMPEVDGCYAIHVRTDGADLIPVTAEEEQHRALLYAQQVAEFMSSANDLVGPAVRPPSMTTYRLVREDA